uniref:MT-A70-domain-containing protein n=1 Tax=Panagrellus redivivus TaxID=6233 RepID=A0A7E4V880_PANRE
MAVQLGEDFCYFDEREIWKEAGCAPPKAEFFDVWEPFWRAKDNESSATVKAEGRSVNSRKRKRGHGAIFMDGTTQTVKTAFLKWKADFEKPISMKTDNNSAREAASKVAEFGFIEKLAELNDDNLNTTTLESDAAISLSTLTLFNNKTDEAVVVNFVSHKFYIPKQSEFIPGPVSALKHLDYANRTFDLIVMDPPWPNKSVKRLKTYKTFEIDDLYDLPIEGLTTPGSVVAMWLTNNPTVHAAVPEILEAWGLVEVARWHWLKVTRSGEPVVSFDWGHKVPFEDVVFARRSDDSTDLSLPKELTLISTPSSSHSRKPPLGLLLPKITNQNYSQKLEVYGRYLIPETTTIGFEALKFQHIETALDYDLN